MTPRLRHEEQSSNADSDLQHRALGNIESHNPRRITGSASDWLAQCVDFICPGVRGASWICMQDLDRRLKPAACVIPSQGPVMG